MRYIFVIILILTAVILSCEKKSVCYECTTTFRVTHTDPSESVSWTVSDTKILCDMTEEQIVEFEINGTDTTSYENDGVITRTISSTECIRQ